MNDMAEVKAVKSTKKAAAVTPPSAPPVQPAPPPAAPAFDIELRTEQVETQCFGVCTVSDIGVNQFEALVLRHTDAKDLQVMARELMCLAVTGPKGERFTPEMLEHLPARAFTDRAKLMRASARIHGLSADDVEKA